MNAPDAFDELRRVLQKNTYARRERAALAWRRKWIRTATASVTVSQYLLALSADPAGALQAMVENAKYGVGKLLAQEASRTVRSPSWNGDDVITVSITAIATQPTEGSGT